MELNFELKNISEKHKSTLRRIAEKEWGANLVVSLGKTYEINSLKGWVAVCHNKVIGFVSYCIENDECEIIALYSEIEDKGVGTALINKVISFAKNNNCKRIKLITTNDNIRSIAFYQKRGFTIANINIDGIRKAREIKPQIPLVGNNGIPIRDEIEFEIKLK